VIVGRRYLPKRDTPEWTELLSAYQQPAADINRLAHQFGFASASSLGTSMLNHGYRRQVLRSPKPRYDAPPAIVGDAVIVCDLQIPFHDAEFIDHILGLAHAWGIKQGVVAGDMLNETAFSFFGHRPEDTWDEERTIARSLMASMVEAVPDWLMLAGNHDMHLIKLMAEQGHMEDLLLLLSQPKGFRTTEYYTCIINGNWRISHPRNCSVIHGRVPGFLARKFQCNIAAGHGHLVGLNMDDSGQWVTVDIGICADPSRLDYANLRDNTRPAMNQGALILKMGVGGQCHPYLLSPKWTDWDAMKRLYGRRER